MDYKELLLKYISHVSLHEGISFIGSHYRHDWAEFTDEEWEELCRLDSAERSRLAGF